jgi:hypothetical protein
MNETESPYLKKLNEKFIRIGWGTWEPTPGVTDEEQEVYLTIHLHLMSVEEALSLSDEEFKRRLWDETLNPREALIRYQQRAGIISAEG